MSNLFIHESDVNILRRLSMVGALQDNELNIFTHQEEKYAVTNRYVFKLEVFLALVIFYDTIDKCEWQKYDYFRAAGESLQKDILEFWSDIIPEDKIFTGTYAFTEQNQKCRKFYSFIENLLKNISVPEAILLANKNDVSISILEYLSYLDENPI